LNRGCQCLREGEGGRSERKKRERGGGSRGEGRYDVAEPIKGLSGNERGLLVD
jgi:hypothetical protein